MDVDAPLRRRVNHLSGKNLAKGGDDDKIRRQSPKCIKKKLFPDLFRLDERQVQLFGQDLNGR